MLEGEDIGKWGTQVYPGTSHSLNKSVGLEFV